jgi:UDP-N-acetylglucosamine acyltransferase
VDETAELASDAEVGAGAYVGPQCRVGPRCRLWPRAMVLGHTSLGADNDIHPCAVLGGEPQDRDFDPSADPGALVVGDGNVFREAVTLNRGAGPQGATRIGSRCYFMTASHAGHNVRVEDDVVLTNHATLAGHVRVERGAVLSAYAGVHQFCVVGALAMLQGHAGVSMHVPPYVVMAGGVNVAGGINLVGLRRSGRFDRAEIEEIRGLYRAVLASRRPMRAALDEERGKDWRPGARRFLDFLDNALQWSAPWNRGVVGAR